MYERAPDFFLPILTRSYLQLEEVEHDLENYAFLVKTQAVSELTFFRGLRSWAQVGLYTAPCHWINIYANVQALLQLTDGLSNALITISTLGAGLVYSTVFGYVKHSPYYYH